MEVVKTRKLINCPSFHLHPSTSCYCLIFKPAQRASPYHPEDGVRLDELARVSPKRGEEPMRRSEDGVCAAADQHVRQLPQPSNVRLYGNPGACCVFMDAVETTMLAMF